MLMECEVKQSKINCLWIVINLAVKNINCIADFNHSCSLSYLDLRYHHQRGSNLSIHLYQRYFQDYHFKFLNFPFFKFKSFHHFLHHWFSLHFDHLSNIHLKFNFCLSVFAFYSFPFSLIPKYLFQFFFLDRQHFPVEEVTEEVLSKNFKLHYWFHHHSITFFLVQASWFPLLIASTLISV